MGHPDRQVLQVPYERLLREALGARHHRSQERAEDRSTTHLTQECDGKKRHLRKAKQRLKHVTN